MSTANRTTPDTGSTGTLLTAIRWISSIVSVLIVVMALMIGQGFFNGRPGLITGHGHLGNGIFMLVALQIVLAFLLFQKGVLGRNMLILNGAIMVLLFAQIGLGYSGTRNSSGTALAWHLPNGVLLMGTSTVNAVLLWARAGLSNRR